MTTHLRIIHPEHREAALAPDNPMRDVPEPLRPLLRDKVAQPLRARLRSS